MLKSCAYESITIAFACPILAACANPEAKHNKDEATQGAATRGGIVREEMPLNEEQQAILAEVKDKVSKFADPAFSPKPEVFRRYFAPEFSELEFSTWPLYKIDFEEFKTDPSVKNLENCIVPSTHTLFMGRHNGRPEFYGMAGRYNFDTEGFAQELRSLLATAKANAAYREEQGIPQCTIEETIRQRKKDREEAIRRYQEKKAMDGKK